MSMSDRCEKPSWGTFVDEGTSGDRRVCGKAQVKGEVNVDADVDGGRSGASDISDKLSRWGNKWRQPCMC